MPVMMVTSDSINENKLPSILFLRMFRITHDIMMTVFLHQLCKQHLILALIFVCCSFSYLAVADDFRPTYHFYPDVNWMNEPNGLIKIDSNWHLFYQHNPDGNYWGNLSWGHATSTDLLHWTYQPIAISSADGIQAFTGTSYYNIPNTSGSGTSDSPPYLAFFTGYFPCECDKIAS